MNTELRSTKVNKILPLQTNKAALGIRGRLYIGFAAITAVLLIAIILVVVRVSAVEKTAESLMTVDLPTYQLSSDLVEIFYELRGLIFKYVVTNDVKYKPKFGSVWKNVDELVQSLSQILQQEQQLRGDMNTHANLWTETKNSIEKLKESSFKIENAINTQNHELVNTVMINEFAPLLDVVLANLVGEQTNSSLSRQGGLFRMQIDEFKADSNEIIHSMDLVRNLLFGLLVVSILLCIGIAYYTLRSIINYINAFRHHSNLIASGDLTQRIEIQTNDEIGQLGRDLNTMTDNLSAITKQITEASTGIVSALSEVRQSIDVQSSGASEQASSINEITVSLEEIEKSSAQTMEKVKELGQVSERTREKGQLGLESVEESVNGMKEAKDKVQVIAQNILDLSNQTQQIGEITGVVNNLAQQLKMLALNASIEASKAGDAGKGFAVVATEVKNLAEQSEESTSQVQKILEDISHATERAVMVTEEGTKGVDQGTRLVEQTGDIMRGLTDVIHEVTLASRQIEAAVRQESIGIEQITGAMNEINQVTSSFVGSVRDTTKAIDDLAEIVKNLNNYINTYRV